MITANRPIVIPNIESIKKSILSSSSSINESRNRFSTPDDAFDKQCNIVGKNIKKLVTDARPSLDLTNNDHFSFVTRRNGVQNVTT